MGSRVAPFIFGRVSMAVMWILSKERTRVQAIPRQFDLRSSMYLDDGAMFTIQFWVGKHIYDFFTVELLLPINYPKYIADGQPVVDPVMLGVKFNLIRFTAELTDDRRGAIVELAGKWATASNMTLKALRSWCGVLTNAAMAVPEIQPLLGPLRGLQAATERNNRSRAFLSAGIQDDMRLLGDLVQNADGSARLWPDPRASHTTSFTDASTSDGVGGWCRIGSKCYYYSILWSAEDKCLIPLSKGKDPTRPFHISVLELLAVLLMVLGLSKAVASADMGKVLVINADNQSAVRVANAGRSSSNELMNLMARKLMLALQVLDARCKKQSTSRWHEVKSEYIKGAKNVGADRLSRKDFAGFLHWTTTKEGEYFLGTSAKGLTFVNITPSLLQDWKGLKEWVGELAQRSSTKSSRYWQGLNK